LVCKPDGTEGAPKTGADGEAIHLAEPEDVASAPAPDDPSRPGRVLVVLEPRPGAAHAVIGEGLRIAQLEGAEVVFVPAGQEAREGGLDAAALRERALAAAARGSVTARCDDLGPAPTPQAIAAHARDLGCRLIVVASEGRNAVTRLLAGSLAPRLITAAETPVLICRDREPGVRERSAARRPRRSSPPAA
jgi:nucleotide-binding universal stress UspA family protein